MEQKLVKISDLFDVKYGNQFDFSKMELLEESEINFISRSSQHQGVIAKVEKYKETEPFPAGIITVTLGGTYLLSSFLQTQPFYTAQNVKVLIPKHGMSDLELLFYCYCISHNRFRYTSHGREANKTLNDLLIPAEIPDEWAKINIEAFSPRAESVISEKMELSVSSWGEFNIADLFVITGSKTTPLFEIEMSGAGSYPFVTTQATNNGIEGCYDYFTEKGNVLVVDSAVLGYCSYQPLDFSASDHVEKLTPKFEIDKYIGLFLATVLNKEQYRYNYGRKASQARLKERSIRLPSRDDVPDWDFMRNYIKSLPYSSNL